jgi:hypothetical protein
VLDWGVQYTNATLGTTVRLKNPDMTDSMTMTPTTVRISSSDDSLSLMWISTLSNMNVWKLVQLGKDDLHYKVTITITNSGDETLKDFYC